MDGVKRPDGRIYGGRTGEQRVAGRRAALVAAAFDLVAAHGWRELSIEALCERARLNKRYFYESFRGLDALVAAVTSRLAEDALAVALAEIAPPMEAAEAIGRAVPAVVAHLTDDPRRARVLFGAVPAGEAAAGHRAAAIRRVIATAVVQGRSLNARADEVAIEVGAAMIVGGTSQGVLDWLDGEIECDRDGLVSQLAAMWRAVSAAVGAASPVRGA